MGKDEGEGGREMRRRRQKEGEEDVQEAEARDNTKHVRQPNFHGNEGGDGWGEKHPLRRKVGEVTRM